MKIEGTLQVPKEPWRSIYRNLTFFVLDLIRGLFNIKSTMFSWKLKEPFRVQKGPKDQFFLGFSNLFILELIRGLFNIKNRMFSWKSKRPFRVYKGIDDQLLGNSNIFVLELIGGLLNITTTAFSLKSKGTSRVYKGPYHRSIKISKPQVIQGLLMTPMFQH